MNYNNEERCKELGLIPIKEIVFSGNFKNKYKYTVNFNCDYGIKIIDNDKTSYNIISLKRKEPLIIEFNWYKDCYRLYLNGDCYNIYPSQINNYINKYMEVLKNEI